eukprot:832365-Prymnesium_polylepis.1
MTLFGIDPLDGGALRKQLLRTDLAGATGRVSFEPGAQDRTGNDALANVQRSASGVLSQVVIGMLPLAPTGNVSSWQQVPIQWPGGGYMVPTSLVETSTVKASVLLSFTNADGTQDAVAKQMFCAARLAERQFNTQDGTVLSALARVTPSLRLQLLPYDTQSDAAAAIVAFDQARRDGSEMVIGAGYSEASISIAARSAGMPQVSPTASSDELSNKALYPGFARVCPADAQVAEALVNTIRRNFWTWTRLGVLHVKDSYGESYLGGLRMAAAATDGVVRIAAAHDFRRANTQDVSRAVSDMRDSGVSIIIYVGFLADLKVVLELADTLGLLTDEYAWILADVVGVADLAETDTVFAARVHGMLDFAFAPAEGPRYSHLARTWKLMDPQDCANELFAVDASWFKSEPNRRVLLAYDSVVALGLALNSSGDLRNALHVMEQLKGLSFEGITGTVNLLASGDRGVEGT